MQFVKLNAICQIKCNLNNSANSFFLNAPGSGWCSPPRQRRRPPGRNFTLTKCKRRKTKRIKVKVYSWKHLDKLGHTKKHLNKLGHTSRHVDKSKHIRKDLDKLVLAVTPYSLLHARQWIRQDPNLLSCNVMNCYFKTEAILTINEGWSCIKAQK